MRVDDKCSYATNSIKIHNNTPVHCLRSHVRAISPPIHFGERSKENSRFNLNLRRTGPVRERTNTRTFHVPTSTWRWRYVNDDTAEWKPLSAAYAVSRSSSRLSVYRSTTLRFLHRSPGELCTYSPQTAAGRRRSPQFPLVTPAPVFLAGLFEFLKAAGEAVTGAPARRVNGTAAVHTDCGTTVMRRRHVLCYLFFFSFNSYD